MTCKCGSDRTIRVSGKCSDLAFTQIDSIDFEHDGYIPHLGLTPGLGGDYIDLTICLDCGTVQEWSPKSDEDLVGTLKDEGLIESSDDADAEEWED